MQQPEFGDKADKKNMRRLLKNDSGAKQNHDLWNIRKLAEKQKKTRLKKVDHNLDRSKLPEDSTIKDDKSFRQPVYYAEENNQKILAP